jgi:hypothetical protein
MTVLPLTSQERELPLLGSPRDLHLVRDVTYTEMVMGTRSPHVTIVPQGLVWLTKERAQDRTIPSAHLVRGERRCPAFCVQSSQGGLMRGGHEELRLLPAGLRGIALAKRTQTGVGTLWDDLAAFNQGLGVSGNFLATFFQDYAKQLAEFVAQFEPVPGQRGAVVLVNDRVAGIELMPSPEAFLALWEPLIRDCYGAEAIARQGQAAPKPAPPPTVSSLDDLPRIVAEMAAGQQARLEKVVDGVLAEKARLRLEQQEGELQLSTVAASTCEGQVVRWRGDTVYMSLLARPPRERPFAWLRRLGK